MGFGQFVNSVNVNLLVPLTSTRDTFVNSYRQGVGGRQFTPRCIDVNLVNASTLTSASPWERGDLEQNVIEVMDHLDHCIDVGVNR